MESHPNCRCTSTAITKSWEELGAEFGFDFSAAEKAGPSFAEVADKYGVTPEQRRAYANRKGSGEAYFRGLKADEQRAILGPAKWLAWKEGKFAFESLSRKTFSAAWGAGVKQASLVELLGEKDANYYLRLTQNGLAKQNLNADELIKFASLDLRPLTSVEIGKISNHVARAGFPKNLYQRVTAQFTGIKLNGKPLNKGESISVGEAHYVKHVILQKEWPIGTSISQYLASLAEVISDLKSSIFISRYHDQLQIGFIGGSKQWKGPDGHDIILVEYRVNIAGLVTGYQPEDIQEILKNKNRTDLKWLRNPLEY